MLFFFAIHQHESATGAHVSPHPEHPTLHPALWDVLEHWVWVPCFTHQTCTGHLLRIWCYTRLNAILSNHATLTFFHRVQKSSLYICVSSAALHIGSLLLSFWIPYVCINIQHLCFSFWLSSLCIIDSSFIHLIRTDSNAFFFIAG